MNANQTTSHSCHNRMEDADATANNIWLPGAKVLEQLNWAYHLITLCHLGQHVPGIFCGYYLLLFAFATQIQLAELSFLELNQMQQI